MSSRTTYDAHDTARPGEPTFTLQGGDPLAPKAIMFYADLVRTEARKASGKKQVRSGLQRAAACETVAWSFEDYQKSGGQPEARRARYNDKDQLAAGAKEAADKRAALKAAAGHLSNARSTAEEAREQLTRFGYADSVAKVERAQALLREVQDLLEETA